MGLGSIKKGLHRFLQKTQILQETLVCVHALFDWQVFSTWLTRIEKVEIPAGREGTSGLASWTQTRTQKKDWGWGRGGRSWASMICPYFLRGSKHGSGCQTDIEWGKRACMSGSSDVGSSSFLWKVEQSSSNLGFASFSHMLSFFPRWTLSDGSIARRN